jgi:hypothetical protein
MSPARICASSRAKSSTVDFFGDFFGEAVLGCGIDLPMRHLILSASGVGSTTIDVVLGKYMVETTTHKPVDRAVSFSGKHFEVAPDAFRKIDRDHFLAGTGRLRPGRPSWCRRAAAFLVGGFRNDRQTAIKGFEAGAFRHGVTIKRLIR